LKDFKELKVWQKAHVLAPGIYGETKKFPKEEIYGLTSQMRRASVSIGANIAEGCGRRSDGEFVGFLQIARGSASELEQHLLLARDLEIMSDHQHKILESQVLEVQRMMSSLVNSIEETSGRRTKGRVEQSG
jgi:four helix bundle protein